MRARNSSPLFWWSGEALLAVYTPGNHPNQTCLYPSPTLPLPCQLDRLLVCRLYFIYSAITCVQSPPLSTCPAYAHPNPIFAHPIKPVFSVLIIERAVFYTQCRYICTHVCLLTLACMLTHVGLLYACECVFCTILYTHSGKSRIFSPELFLDSSYINASDTHSQPLRHNRAAYTTAGALTLPVSASRGGSCSHAPPQHARLPQHQGQAKD